MFGNLWFGIVDIHTPPPPPITNMFFFVSNFPNLEILVKEQMEKIMQIQKKCKQPKNYQKIKITNFFKKSYSK